MEYVLDVKNLYERILSLSQIDEIKPERNTDGYKYLYEKLYIPVLKGAGEETVFDIDYNDFTYDDVYELRDFLFENHNWSYSHKQSYGSYINEKFNSLKPTALRCMFV